MSVALDDVVSVPAEVTERPFTPVDTDAAEKVIEGRLLDAMGNFVYARVLQALGAGSKGKLGFKVEAEIGVYDAAKRTDLGAADYSYRHGRETFTVELDPEEIAAAISNRAASAVGGGIDDGDGTEDFVQDPDPEATVG